MRNGSILAGVLAVSGILTSPLGAQAPYTPRGATPTDASEPQFPYAVSPQSGPWLICVQVFKCDRAKELAQGLAEYIIREYKVPAYLFEGNRKERLEEKKRVAELRKKYDDFVDSMMKENPKAAAGPFRTKTMQFQEEFGVLIGHPKGIMESMEVARKFLNEVRKFKAPPEEFCTRMLQARPAPGQEGGFLDKASLNPFETAFVAPNMTLPRVKPPEHDVYPVLERLNAGEPHNVLKCSKAYTLVVRIYTGAPTVLDRDSDGTATGRIGFGRKEGENLNASAMQARALAEYLRKMKPNSYDGYVMHTQYYTLVTVGNYGTPDDPELKATQTALGGMKLQAGGKGGTVIDSLMPEPVIMMIPRPKK